MTHEKVMRKSFIVNIFLIIFKIISGVLFSSLALIADGIHSISDLLSDVFVILGIRHSVKPADDDHPFGHGKFEYILSLFLGISIITMAFQLAKNVIQNFNDVPKIPATISLAVVVIVVVIKFILARYLIVTGNRMDSQIIKASGKESLTDVYSSIVVFVGIITVIIGDMSGNQWLLKGDKVASIMIALFIVKIGVEIILSSIHSLQGHTVDEKIKQKYEEIIAEVVGVIKVDQLDMITYGPYYQAVVEIRVDGNMTVTEGHDIAQEVTKRLNSDEKICHVVVHVNPEE